MLNSDSKEYRGGWLDDLKHGKGRKVFEDGDIYDGEWLGDKKHGKGMYS